ncbi:hypothetical protein [Helicobacter sp.]|uniref:hypothetical protein n=1 Tax=Helicobacter sp. TaxID=218 RepID=UPI0025C01449|nr:hypothetical protein [Helicobacter sp.]
MRLPSKLLKNLVWAIGLFISCAQGIDFSPAPTSLDNRSFGSFSIGGVRSSITHTSGEMLEFKDYKSTRGAVIFGLKRGLMFGDSQRLLLNAWIDGRAGQENKNGLFAFSLGAQGGVRLFGGRVIGLLGGGFEMSNLATPEEKEQYNIYGGLAKAEIFIDIARGYGLSVGYTRGFNYKSKKLLGERFDTSSLMLTLSYYDFSI